MNNSSKKPIITHIPDFLEYYENKRYSQRTNEEQLFFTRP